MLSPQCRQKMQDRSDLVQNGFLKREKAVIATIIGQFDTGQFDTADNFTPENLTPENLTPGEFDTMTI